MTETPPEESDQRPEEAPPRESDQRPEEAPLEVVEEGAGGRAREGTKESPGVPGEEETATGNPDAAGADEPD